MAFSLSTEMISVKLGLCSFILPVHFLVAGGASMPALLPNSLAFSLQIESFDHLLAGKLEVPLLGVVVCIDKVEHHAIHVRIIWVLQVRGIQEIEGDGLAVGRGAGFHAWLI